MATEKRLIDANALVVPKYKMEGRDLFNQGYCQGKIDGILEVKAIAPTEDVAEVVHGRWEYYSTNMMECSNCKRHTAPHCGAIMEDKYHE